jgi:hypothetical protein
MPTSFELYRLLPKSVRDYGNACAALANSSPDLAKVNEENLYRALISVIKELGEDEDINPPL